MTTEDIRVPTRNGTGVTVGSFEAIARERGHVRSLLDSLVTVRCDCQIWEVTLPIKEHERCRLCGGELRYMEEDNVA